MEMGAQRVELKKNLTSCRSLAFIFPLSEILPKPLIDTTRFNLAKMTF
jgi:hypothetical protein